MNDPTDASALAALFAAHDRPTFGVEEEFMLLDPSTLDLAPRAAELLAARCLPPGTKLELPASQVEVASSPAAGFGELGEHVRAGRTSLAAALAPDVRLAGAGAHPFAAPAGVLNRGPRYDRIHAEYGWVAECQLICGMHVHVALPGGDRALAVYNALRSYVPDMAALGANAPYREGRDTGLASVRPLVATMLPRQGVPPALEGWAHYARELSWAHRGGRIASPREWWWELRLHAGLGTIELRVADTQTTVAEALAVAGFVGALAVWLGERHDAADLPHPAESWRISENRWAAARYGLDAPMVDVHSGARACARERLQVLLDRLEGTGAQIGATACLTAARALSERNGAMRQREIGGRLGAAGLARWLAEAFLSDAPAGG